MSSAAAAAADLVLTNADAVATAADRVQTGLDAAATGADALATANDAVNTSADAVSTANDASATSADAIATAADRVQTGLDRVSTTSSASSAAASALEAAASATQTLPSRNNVVNQDPVSQGTAARAGMSSTIYTGTGASLAVNTGVDMATGDFGGFVWVKSRSNAIGHALFDTVRLPANYLTTNSTAAELVGITGVTSFDTSGFTLGANTSTNTNTATYASWSWQTTEKTTGTTNRNKAYTCHYNDNLGFSIVGYEGDGVDGHEIPHYLGKEPELVIFKNRDAALNWIVQSPIFNEQDFLNLNTTNALVNDATLATLFSGTTVRLDTTANYNANTQNHIAYNFTSIPNVSKIGTYKGTGAAGNYVDCGFKVGWVMVKCLTTAVTSWHIFDASRGVTNLLLAEGSNAEFTGRTDIEFVDDGFVINATVSGVNGLNAQHIFMAFAESTAFDGTKTLTNYDYATTDEVLTINEGTLMSFAEGFNANGQVDTQELVGVGTTLSFGTGFEDQTRYVYKDKASTYGSSVYRPLEGISRAQADKFGLVSPLDAATRTTDKHFGYESATGVALASSEFAGGLYPAWKAFNKDSNNIVEFNYWQTASGTTTGTLQYKFSEPRVLKSWRLRGSEIAGRLPRRFTIEGSNDGLGWTAIDSTYAASDFPNGGVNIWSGIQDTSANTSAYIYTRINVTAVDGSVTFVAIGELEFNTITPSDYYNVVDGQVYNNAGTVIDRVYLAKVNTGASGEILNFEKLPVAKIKGVDQELQGDSTVHGEIKNRGVCTAWVNFDGTTNPPTKRDSYNVYDVVDLGVGQYEVIFETPMDDRGFSVSVTKDVSDILNSSYCYESQPTRTDSSIRVISQNGTTVGDSNSISIQIFGGKSI
ncbi:discoidin domain-containing protein [Akkermansiaceae bacterium]|nr:discoidin domain-containing protein [Akkermansiaceae bacterium]